MQIHAIIFNWPRQTPNAERLEAVLQSLVSRCDVVNSDIAANRTEWYNIGDAYFTEQWQAARDLLDRDIMLMVCADVWSDRLSEIITRAVEVMHKFQIGIYAPNVDWTSWVFNPRQLGPPIEHWLYQVPQTDALLLFVRAEIVHALPPLNPLVNKLGWGIDHTLVTIARQFKYLVCRDYKFTVQHPHNSNYDTNTAYQQMNAWIDSFQPSLRAAVRDTIQEARMVQGKPRKSINKKPSILVTITNYALSSQADNLKLGFSKHFPTILIDNDSPIAPRAADLVIENRYYPSLWNAAVGAAIIRGVEWLLFIASDVEIDNIDLACSLISETMASDSVGIMTASLDMTSRVTFDTIRNKGTNTVRESFLCEGFFFLARVNLLRKLYPLSINNKYGWGVDIAACRIASNNKLRVVVDDRIIIHHPRSKHKIDLLAAEKEMHEYLNSLP